MYIYHKDLGFPNTLHIPDFQVHLEYSHHAQERTKRKKLNQDGSESDTMLYDLNLLPKMVRISKENIFEIETKNNKRCKKVLIRIKYDNKRDMILVLQILHKKLAKVVTLWLNARKDNHKTINMEKYTIPQK